MKTSRLSFLVSCLVILFIGSICGFKGYKGFKSINPNNASEDSTTLKLIFAGDVMGHSTQIKGAWREGGKDSCYNFIPNFKWVKNYISSADIAVANLEVTLAGEPYTGYPAFSSPVSLATALQDAGFDILVTANNHIMDRGQKGLERTIQVLDSLGIMHTGSFKDSAQWINNHPLMIEKNGVRLAFLNYTYGTNISKAKPPIKVNYIDTTNMAADLERACELNADFVIAFLHWGEEYKNEENETQRQIADFLAKNGCNLIVGAHPHVVQPIKKVEDFMGDSVLVAYSLGNFVSNQRWRYSDGGIMLEVTLTKSEGKTTLRNYRYEPFWVRRYPEKGVQVYRLIPVIDYLDYPDDYPKMSAADEKMLKQFYEDTKRIIPVED